RSTPRPVRASLRALHPPRLSTMRTRGIFSARVSEPPGDRAGLGHRKRFVTASFVAADPIELGLCGVRFFAEFVDKLLRRPSGVLGDQFSRATGGVLLPGVAGAGIEYSVGEQLVDRHIHSSIVSPQLPDIRWPVLQDHRRRPPR